jgi:hypothetical protein
VSTRAAQPAEEGVAVDVVREDHLAVDLDDRQQLPVAALELVVAADVDRLELELRLAAQLVELGQGPLAEVAAGGVEDADEGYG